jgi:two-component system CheB/CheR fusion protein
VEQMENSSYTITDAYQYAATLFGNVSQPVMVMDKDGAIVYNNGAFKNLAEHWSPAPGKTHDDNNEIIFLSASAVSLMSDKGMNEHHFEATSSCGLKQLQIQVRATRVNFPSPLQGTTIFLFDENVQQNEKEPDSESWFRHMADQAPAMIWKADAKGKFTFFNKAWLEFTGKEMKPEIDGGWKENVYKEDIDGVYNTCKIVYNNRQPIEKDLRLKRKDGEFRWIKCFANPSYTPDKRFNGFVGTCYETHNQVMTNEWLEKIIKERTEELKRINLNLEHSNTELKQFAYVASHDLQEPLRKIITYADRIIEKKEKIPPDLQLLVTRIIDSSKRMTKLIEDVLNFSSISNTEKNFVRLDLKAILREVLYNFDLLINQKNAKLTATNLPIIEMVPSQMRQLFHNLISNALKFSRPDSPEIIIDCAVATADDLALLPPQSREKKYYHITVHDNGIGFEEKFAETIFEIFRRLNDKHSYPGTGIGLALCKKIVDFHNGHIYAHSKEEEWTTFHILLPEKQ